MPFTGQKMVIEYIDDHTRIMLEAFLKMCLAFIDDGMSIGKTVNFPVENYPLFDQFRIFLVVPALDIITDEIPNFYFVRTA